MRPAGLLHARILRSPHAHARIRRIDLEPARRLPGVVDVFCGADVERSVEPWGDLTQDILTGDRIAFARDKAVYQGQEVAVAVAETKWQAEDAIEAIEVDYEPLEPLVDPEQAMQPDAPVIQDGVDYEGGVGNAYDASYRIRVGDFEFARDEADVVVRARFTTGCSGAAALEPHACLADYNPSSGKLTFHSATQMVHPLRDGLSKALHLPRTQVRVVAPFVGGGFGSKGDVFPWEVITAVASIRTGRPVRCVLSRREVFETVPGRGRQVRYAELAMRADGTITAYGERVIFACGGVSAWGNQILRIGTQIGMLPYAIPNIHVDGFAVHTNTGPAGPVRGFGVPEAIFAKEQLVDMAATELGLDPVEVRLRNVLHGDDCPTVTPLGQRVDSTSIDRCLERAAEAIDRSEAEDVGVGFAVCMKYTSARHPSLDSDLASVRIVLETDGTVSVFSGDSPHGQGHGTTVAQVVADALGVGVEKVRVTSSDTETCPFSLGTWGSRGGAILGTAARMAAERVRAKLIELAAHILETAPEELEVAEDRVRFVGMPGTGLFIQNLVLLAAYATHQLPEGFEPGPIQAQATYDTPTERERSDGTGNLSPTYSAAAHAARVEVDRETGRWRVLDYVMAHDTGVIINPLIVEGQHQGAFLHGYAMVFGEEVRWGEDGAVANAGFKEYFAPSAADLPSLHPTIEVPAPSTVIPGGQKGAGESATAPVAATIANALQAATGVRFCSLPIMPDDVKRALVESERRGAPIVYPRDMPDYDGPTEWPEPEEFDDLELID
ncbi:MAG: xanthine dehydrogenase family protein [Actinobacteria bacterium]|nr:xanthine dehydrogenase family protein [Actinomycetota bacterium]